jgi:hypothetical protein
MPTTSKSKDPRMLRGISPSMWESLSVLIESAGNLSYRGKTNSRDTIDSVDFSALLHQSKQDSSVITPRPVVKTGVLTVDINVKPRTKYSVSNSFRGGGEVSKPKDSKEKKNVRHERKA